MKKNKILISSVLTIALCLSMISGATFALFTDKSETNVAVTSGKIDVVATIENVVLGTELESQLPETNYTIVNGNELTLTGMVPGDYIKFDLKVVNNSDVTVLYRTILKVAADNGLWAGLNVQIGEEEYLGNTKIADWESLAPNNDPAEISVKISLPRDAGNAYQGKSCSIAYTVEAVQGNAHMDNADADILEIYTATDLLLFADSVKNGNSYAGETVALMADIDLAGINWTGIGVNNISQGHGRVADIFQGTFEGNGHKVSNMSMSNDYPDVATAGFFNALGANASVEDLTIENAEISSTHYAGAIVGWAHTEGDDAQIKNCHVVNATITSSPELVNEKWDNGDKAGGIAGYLYGYTVSDCTVEDSTICAYRDLGGIIGYATRCTVSGCSVENISTIINKMHNYKDYTSDDEHDAGAIVGETSDSTVADDCSGTANSGVVRLVHTAEELKTALLAGGNVTIMNDIDMSNADWQAVTRGYSDLTINGNGHSLTGMTSPLIAYGTYDIAISNLTIKDSVIGDAAAEVGFGAFIQYNDAGSVNMNNCHLVNSKLISTKDTRVGGLVGWASGNVTLTDCSVDNCTLSVPGSCGALIGHTVGNTAISNCEVKGNTSISCTEDRENGDAKAGYLVGTIEDNTTTISNCTVDATVSLNNINAEPVAEGMVGRCNGTVNY